MSERDAPLLVAFTAGGMAVGIVLGVTVAPYGWAAAGVLAAIVASLAIGFVALWRCG